MKIRLKLETPYVVSNGDQKTFMLIAGAAGGDMLAAELAGV